MTTEIDATHSVLREIPINLIVPNPENPRLLFRQGELDQLLESIRMYGVQVPISVYRDGRRFVLIDGERRWRCSRKLNKQTIPALVQEKPSALTNLLLMFNIHSLREQWDLMTIALKLPRILELLRATLGREPREAEISNKTGLPRAVIRRSKLLMDLPEHHQDQIVEELKKPKSQQRLTEDFYIEMERALTTVARAMPEVIGDRERVRKVLIDKYRHGTISNIVQFRQLAKIARAETVSADGSRAGDVLRRVFTRNDYGIEQAFRESVSVAYFEKDIRSRIQTLLERLTAFTPDDVDEDLRRDLQDLMRSLAHLLEAD